jgi:general secretion pathway protein A
MYNEFYGFSESPFEVVPDPKFLYFTPNHLAVLSCIMDGIEKRKGLISITGEVGTGKTTFIHSLLKRLDEKVKTVFIFHTTIPFKELLKSILHELDLVVNEKGKQALLNRLNEYLIQMAEDEPVAVIIDEAQDLPESVAQEIGGLFVANGLTSKKLQMIFVGQPEFEEKLRSQSLRQLNQCITIRREITPLTEKESKAYIDHRLTLVGSSCLEAFTPEAISLIVRYARGIPRIINILCDNAFLDGYALSKKRIDADIIREVIKDMKGSVPKKAIVLRIFTFLKGWRLAPFGLNVFHKRISMGILSLFCVGVILLLGYGFLRPRSTTSVGPIKILRTNNKPSSLSPSSAEPAKKIPDGDNLNVSSKQESPSLASLQPGPPPSASPTSKHWGDPFEETIVVREGQTVSSIVEEYYGITNKTLCEVILQFNPAITNIHLITVDQTIRLPKISEERLIIESPDLTYKLFAGTFWAPSLAKVYSNEPALDGKEVEIIPRQVSPQETWYRVEIGTFDRKEDVVEVIHRLKEKGLLPLFEGGRKKK